MNSPLPVTSPITADASIDVREDACKQILAFQGMNAKIDALRALETRCGLKAVPLLTRWSVDAQDQLRAKDFLGSYGTVEAGVRCLLDLPSSRF